MFVIPIYIIIYIIEQYYNFWLGRSSYDERQIDILKKMQMKEFLQELDKHYYIGVLIVVK